MKLHLLQFDDEQAAQNDVVVGAYWLPPTEGGEFPFPGGWDQSRTFPNTSVFILQASQAGFWIIIATDDANTALAQHPNCRLAWDNMSAVILGGTYTGNDMSALFVSPVPAGAYNPWNGAAPE
ncbi:hypothetical protein [Bradyrhizobium japonicum]|uniref:hypothetical protein n=1 Tax=Bradyrhizobium japonicum TaxID=375 RepID=UPI001BA70A26|nr:hypothetical protein [Bradyrhizobium japonicum]MBR0962238.1 hypothetical protein [Bradyrhizobium japonicum]